MAILVDILSQWLNLVIRKVANPINLYFIHNKQNLQDLSVLFTLEHWVRLNIILAPTYFFELVYVMLTCESWIHPFPEFIIG